MDSIRVLLGKRNKKCRVKPSYSKSFVMNLLPTLKNLNEVTCYNDSEARQTYNQTMRDFSAR